ncbi:MAG: thioredoxin family protein [gamma proteobacterium symbiont of Bathyaustriella thionipta]|nr:thioredoxin family protein [gamma proteobacterium symbiont of Bathyaustriella thionipta]
MTFLSRFFITLMLACVISPLAAGESLPAWSRGYSAQRDPFQDAHEAIALAQSSGRRILIEVGGDWCAWCHVLEKLIANNPDIEQVLQQNYVLLKVSVDEHNDNAEFLKGLPYSYGFPKLYVSRANGSIIHVQNSSDFMQNGRYSAAKVMDFLQQWKPVEP